MPFALGVAIAEEFARIAALLAMGGPHGGAPGGGGSGGPSPPPHQPPPPPPVIPPSPRPGGGNPVPPGIPFPWITVPPVNTFPTTPPPPPACPIYSATDYQSLLALETRASTFGTGLDGLLISPGTTGEGMPDRFTGLTPVEAVDFFRFRTFGSATNIAVSFFGRVIHKDGQIVPFNHVLTTDGLNTVFQTLPVTGVGWLLGAAASVPLGSITTGAVTAIGEIGRMAGTTFTPHTLLFSGQLTDQQPLSSTLASPTQPVTNPTFFQQIQSNGVSNSTSLTITPTPGKVARFTSIKFDYIASAVAGNRQGVIQISTGGTIRWEGLTDQAFIASQEMLIRAAMDGPSVSPAVALPAGFREMSMPLPDSLYFNSAVNVLGGVFGVQAGDVAFDLTLRWEET